MRHIINETIDLLNQAKDATGTTGHNKMLRTMIRALKDQKGNITMSLVFNGKLEKFKHRHRRR